MIDSYAEATEYLFTCHPMFQRVGAGAYKPGLETALTLSEAFGSPHKGLRCIHVAGTNGKGSTAHSIAAVLQKAGYKTGLYTSPHLVDFRERIRVDGCMIPKEYVVDFTARYRNMTLQCQPSFFELTTIMAFEYFRHEQVDVAVVETGLGGRLDTTNIITPDLCIITNISLDHTALLGDTPEAIAREKAGIIKPEIPVVIGEALGAVREVFSSKAAEVGAPIVFACDDRSIDICREADGKWHFRNTPWGDVEYGLEGECQKHNGLTVLTSLAVMTAVGYRIASRDVVSGLAQVCETTGLAGRWMSLGDNPKVVCDTGHNSGGWQYLVEQIAALPGVRHMVIGFVNDKDVSDILHRIAAIDRCKVYFTRASVDRALPVEELAEIAARYGISGEMCADVPEAYEKALAESGKGDSIFVGGSTFVVADLLAYLR